MLEVICETVQDAIHAAESGADRIELVSALCDGGLTPSIALVEHVCNYVLIPVRVMIRPHARSFIYDMYDQEVILKDLLKIKATKAEGIVFGALKEDKTIDYDLLNQVIKHKGHLKLTFHRAIDETKDYLSEIKTLLEYPIDSVLTSGSKPNAIEAIDLLNQIKHEFDDKGIELLAGKGIQPDNIEEFITSNKDNGHPYGIRGSNSPCGGSP
jgi:copper homeostasis protein